MFDKKNHISKVAKTSDFGTCIDSTSISEEKYWKGDLTCKNHCKIVKGGVGDVVAQLSELSTTKLSAEKTLAAMMSGREHADGVEALLCVDKKERIRGSVILRRKERATHLGHSDLFYFSNAPPNLKF